MQGSGVREELSNQRLFTRGNAWINSQNNERLFFSDQVVLVEGVPGRIFFESLLDSSVAVNLGAQSWK